MIIQQIREEIAESFDDSIFFDNPSFDKSIIGITPIGEVVYSLHKMIHELMDDNNMNEEEALDFIEFNTVRSIPYIDYDKKPIIVDETIIKSW